MSRIPEGVVLIAAAAWHDEHPGGANRLPTEFARFLASRGYAVTYLCASGSVTRTADTRIDGVDVRRYPSPSAPSPSLRNLLDHWRCAAAIAREVDGSRPVDVLLGHAPLQYLGALGALRGPVRRCYGVHSPFVAELKEGVNGKPSIKQRVAWRGAEWLERRILKRSDLVHFDSDYTRSCIEAAYPNVATSKGVVLPGWVDDRQFHLSDEPRSVIRQKLGPPWQPGVPTFFTLRRLVHRMGLDTLIDAAARLVPEGYVFRVVIGGDGPERSSLTEQIAAHGLGATVTMLGRVAADRVAQSMAAADCFILPTRSLECFGLIILEAFACGVPVIGVPVGSIPEVMGADLRAWLAEDNGAPALADRMRAFLSGGLSVEPERFRQRAAAFAFDQVAARHERVIVRGHDNEAPPRTDVSAWTEAPFVTSLRRALERPRLICRRPR